MLGTPQEEYTLVDHVALRQFVTEVFTRLKVPPEDAAAAADILVRSDLRGIDSHGVARLDSYYVTRLMAGTTEPCVELRVERETPTSLLLDARNGLGMVVGYHAMQRCIDKARESGLAMVTVANSNHYGIAGYYAMMALPHDMIGISLTNASRFVVPTFGKESMFGTNPIAFAAPTKEELPFVLDMATSGVAVGKLEIALRQGVPIPLGWAQDKDGHPTTDPRAGLIGRALMPLGGTREHGSHKGYGLAVMVDILCGVLSGNGYGPAIQPSKTAHFFAAMRVDAFRDVDDFKTMMDAMIRDLRASGKAEGHDRIYVAGEIEWEYEKERKEKGIPLHPLVIASLKTVSEKTGVPLKIG